MKDTIYHRVLDPAITKSVNIYGLAGNDKFVYKMNKNNGTRVRLFGGNGNDLYIDSLDGNHLSKSSIYDASDDVDGSARAT